MARSGVVFKGWPDKVILGGRIRDNLPRIRNPAAVRSAAGAGLKLKGSTTMHLIQSCS